MAKHTHCHIRCLADGTFKGIVVYISGYLYQFYLAISTVRRRLTVKCITLATIYLYVQHSAHTIFIWTYMPYILINES